MNVLINNLDLWRDALVGTLTLFFGGAVIAIVLGILIGGVRVSPVPVARAVATVYVTLVRNSPLTLLFFVFAFAVPVIVGQNFDFTVLGIWALGVYTATYVAEVLRSGFNTVAPGEAEAGRAIGLGYLQVMSLIVLPQSLRAMVPPLASVFIALLKNTTIAAGFSVLNLGSIRSYLSERGENAFEVILWVMIIFAVMVLALTALQRRIERRFAGKVAR